jgi:hypothetical protein
MNADSGPLGIRGGAGASPIGLRLALLATLAIVLSLLLASAADADSIHGFTSSFGTAGSGPGQMELVAPDYEVFPQVGGSGVAVNPTTHDVYVADTGNDRVDEFEADGTFVRAFGWGVTDGLPQAETCTTISGCQAGIAGTGAGQLDAPTFIAVDDSPGGGGDLYVADAAEVVQKFTEDGELVSTWGEGGRLPAPIVAAGTADLTTGSTKLANLHAVSGQFGQFPISGEGVPAGTRLEPREGELQLTHPATLTKTGVSLTQTATFGPLAGLAVGPTGNLWTFDQGATMFEFDHGGAFVRLWASQGATPSGVATDEAENVYLVEGGRRRLLRFTAAGIEVGALTPPAPGGGTKPPPDGFAVNGITGDVYVDVAGSIEHIAPSCQPAPEGCGPTERFGSLAEGARVAVDSSDGNVFAADAGTQEVSLFGTTLEATTGGATGIEATGATALGTVNPEGTAVSECEFEYGPTAEYGQGAPCEEAVGAGTSPVAVHADLTGLEGGNIYHFRLTAASAKGTVSGEDETFETTSTPTVSGVEAAALTASSVDLKALIDPNGLDTSYQFEYGTTTTYGTKVPIPAAGIGSGNVAVPVTQRIEGLSPGVPYDFRVVATDTQGDIVVGENHTFVLGAVPVGLPDGRQYELVTPAVKNAALIGALFLHNIQPQISADGSRLMVASGQCFGGSPSCVGVRQTEGEPYLLGREGAAGWQPHPLAPPVSAHATNSWWAISAATGDALFSSSDPSGKVESFYMREPSGAERPIGPLGEAGFPYSSLLQEPLLATTDMSYLVYGTAEPAWAKDGGDRDPDHLARSLYEYVGAEGSEPLLVGVGGPDGGQGSTDLIGTCGAGIGNGKSSGLGKRLGSLSADGRIIYFSVLTCPAGGTGANAGDPVHATSLYMRVDGERLDAHTVAVSAATPSSCEEPACEANSTAPSAAREANFEGASSDGSIAIFTSTQQLTDDATQDPNLVDTAEHCSKTTEEGSGCNLYLSRCPDHCEDRSQRTLTDLSAAPSGGPRVQGTLSLAPDGSRVYFVAKGVLTASANRQGQRAHQGLENLYLYESGHVVFIAALSPQDAGYWTQENFDGDTANVTDDGRYLLFLSRRGLTPDARQGEGPPQVYRYDADSGVITRISIGDDGFNDDGNDAAGGASIVAASSTVEASTVPQPANPSMSDDGSYIFFQSPAALTPGALDNVAVEEGGYVQNVYEYHEGHVYLISDGKDTSLPNRVTPSSVQLLGTDASGSDVFFSTVDQLTWQDTDTQRDYYDARIGGGIAEPPAPGACGGEECRGAASTPGPSPAAGTADFSGPGNPVQKKPRHQKKKHHKKRRHRRHHNSTRGHHERHAKKSVHADHSRGHRSGDGK